MKQKMFLVKPRHWWLWLLPSTWKAIRAINAVLDSKQEELLALYYEHTMNLMLFGNATLVWGKDGELRSVVNPEANQN